MTYRVKDATVFLEPPAMPEETDSELPEPEIKPPMDDDNQPSTPTPPNPDPELPAPTNPEESPTVILPDNWADLSVVEKIILNPWGCHDTTKIRADNGQCLSGGYTIPNS